MRDSGQTENFRLSGRLAVNDGRDGGSAGFLWQQTGSRFRFELRQPVSQRTWLLTGDDHGAVLEGGGDGPRRGDSAEILLREVLGWHVPVTALRDWVRGMPQAGAVDEIERDQDGRPIRFRQQGWQVEYRAWEEQAPWPTRIHAQRPPYSVRLNIRDWAVRDR